MRSILNRSLLLLTALTLSNCKAVVLSPSGDIALQQRDLLIQSTLLMLLIIIPVMALIVFFSWKYRASNKDATYEPDWDHSTHLELVIWSAPLLIIICLGAITWLGTHLLDPYRPLDRLAKGQQVAKAAEKLEVNVVALDWKWLFIYPEYNIGTVNELAVPVNRPLDFHITASSVMNSFYIPALAGQIYAMAGMETRLHAVLNQPGEYEGFSANYSGAGFSDMKFAFHGYEAGEFNKWVGKVKKDGIALNRTTYRTLVKPSEKNPVQYYSSVESGLYRSVLSMCVDPGPSCMSMHSMPGKNDSTRHGDNAMLGHNMSDME
jgi:cytochrome o ubiquinol oxidase subunit 2